MITLGVIGGLGPLATACFMELLTEKCAVTRDQDHIDTIVYSHPSIPDRTASILSGSPSPVGEIVRIGKILKEAGADVIAIPCVTSHYYYDDIVGGIGLPMINMLTSTASDAKRRGSKNVGIMATSGTVSTGLFQKALGKLGIDATVPDKEYQDIVMHIIYDCVKAGIAPDKADFDRVFAHLNSKGAESVILGCTELSVVNKRSPLGEGYIDALDVLALECLKYCEMPIK